MALFCRVIQLQDLPEILDFENKKLQELIPDEMERTLHSWNVRWRKEALEHYFALGWSFLVRDKDKTSPYSDEGLLVGYFMAQPLLFVDGQTQSLWVEHLQYASLQARDELCELAYKLSREKHFQKVYFPNVSGINNSISAFKAEAWNPAVMHIKTTKA
ncbi:hypothetical protein [Bdellovibrio sp. HCB337]|uniref:hypothetical protein n=1 Tax=Bdellovibrio sp. HCB337 TaxID=3394358 RepID=UPI0039A4A17F